MRFPIPLRRSPFDAAIQQLRDGRPGEAGYGRRITLLLTIPAFDDPVAHDVRRTATGEMHVVRTVWQRALDLSPRTLRGNQIGAALGLLELTRNPQPSLWSTRLPVDAAALDALLESVVSAVVPCQPCLSEPPLEATIFELTFGDELNETRFRWGGEPPSGWEPLASFATRLLRLVDVPAGSLHR
jgi:hypothetical protein